MKTDGTEKQVLDQDANPSDIGIANDWVFYGRMDSNASVSLNIISLDGKNNRALN